MTTVEGELDLVQKERKRPSETSTSAKTARVPFGNNPTALLGIPVLDNKYNHHVGAVDQGNQLKAGYIFQEIHRRGGHHSLITWLLETTLVNSYLLSFYSSVLAEEKFTDHKAFRQAIIDRCFEIGRSGRQKKRKRSSPTYAPQTPSVTVPIAKHRLVSRERKGRGDCAVCKRGVKRRVLGELDGNKRGCEYRKSTTYGCKECDVPLCKEGTCFDTFHSLELE